MTKWNLTDYFKTEEDFYTTRERCLNQAKNIGKYRSDILNNINALLEEYEQLNDDFSSVYTYASQKYHLNMKDSKNIEDYSQTMNVANEIDGLTSWLNPEFVKLEKSDILNELTEENKLRYAYTLERTFNSKKYFLSASEENIIVNLEKAKKSVVDSYQALTISDNSPAKVEINGEEVLVTAANYSKLLTELESQEDRKNVFEAYFKFYEEHSTTLACMYNNVLSINSSIAKLRGFNSSIEAQLHKNNIPVEIYTTLVASVKENTLFLKEFLNFRKEELGLETIHTYDRMRKVYSSSKQYPYEEGYDICLKAASTVSDEYHDLVKKVLQDGWIDVYPDENKITGAYSWGTYNTHPYILHNYNNTLNSVYTLMHEAGHSIHSHLAAKHQTFFNSQYPIFLAEVASTFAECVLTDYLLENENDEDVKKTLVEENILGIIGTFYRQTLFADFEMQAHDIVDSGKSLTSDMLCDIMQNLYLEYYDIDLNTESAKKLVWAYIPHLINTPFYVYQYSTCIAASFAIFSEYSKSKEKGIEILFNILKKGGSDFPNDILLENNIDLSKKKTYEAVVEILSKQFNEIK